MVARGDAAFEMIKHRSDRDGIIIAAMKQSAALMVATLLWCAAGQAQRAPEREPPQAQTPHPEYWSHGNPNGRYWRNLRIDEKILWLIAYRQGLEDATFDSIQDQHPDADVQTVVGKLKDKMAATLYPPSLTVEEVGMSLETFFATPENRPIPIRYALTMICFKAAGMTQATLDEVVSHLRRDWSGEK